jgi:hypothetical protein
MQRHVYTYERAWNPPAQGTTARKEMPRSAFLEPSVRKYPYKVRRNGRWVISDRGLVAAYRRAAQQGNKTVMNKALRILNRRRKTQGKPLLPR